MIGYLTPNYPLVAAFRDQPVVRTRVKNRPTTGLFKTAPNLADYFPADEILASKGDLGRPISGLASDSRRVLAGNVFFALPGNRTDGHAFIDQAISRGAVAIVAEKIPSGTAARVTYIQVADVRWTLAKAAQRFNHFPDRSLEVLGVTGTNGKTTVAHLIKHLLATTTQRVGLVGTINYDLGNRVVPAYQTTPESLELYGLLAQMREAGCRQAVVEVSSHGLDQQRVGGLQFGVAVFTNFTADHLDYHGTNAAYFRAKGRFFNGENGPLPKVAVVNIDDAGGRELAAALPAGVRLISFGESATALVRAEQVQVTAHGTTFRLIWPEGAIEVECPLLGRYNVSNLLAAFAACYALGRDPAVIAVRLKYFSSVPGRMERISAGSAAQVYVDYAHTPAAMRASLSLLRTLTPGRLFVVYGCGGQRDRSQRAQLTKIVQEIADQVWVTADNPRAEPLSQIFADQQAGVIAAERIAFVPDRREAIRQALAAARVGDCVLIAGKGHEIYQKLADTIVPFDDRQVARELLASSLG